MQSAPRVIVLISANAEWRPLRVLFPDVDVDTTPFGECFAAHINSGEESVPVLFVHGGWGKIAAAASTQYAISRWAPELLVNIGTCGGFEGKIESGAIVLAERTVVYDIIDQMGDADEHIAHYTTEIDLSWLGDCSGIPVNRVSLVSADRDLHVEELEQLGMKYQAVAGDWESGAIAYVTALNRTRCLILRGVSDLVGAGGGEVYGNEEMFQQRAAAVMEQLVGMLPEILTIAMK
jgi:adenosylhomocysteine nucleosidase